MEKEHLSDKRSSLLPLHILNIPVEKEKVSQRIWALEHLLFGSMPLKKSHTKLGWSMNIIPECQYFPLQGQASRINHHQWQHFFFLTFKPDKFRIKCHQGDILQIVIGPVSCVRSGARHWGLGSPLGEQSPESLPSYTLESSELFWNLLYLKEHTLDEKTIV